MPNTVRPRRMVMRVSPLLLPATILVGAILLLAERVFAQAALPLWLDETWTATISGQSTWFSFWRETWLDCNPPLYYVVMKIWMTFAGASNVALRAPSLVFVILAAVLPMIWKIRGLTREARLTWAALLFFWWPGLSIAVDARCYGLLLLISTGQAIAYANMMQRPSTGRALRWMTLASLAVLTHYYAATIVAAQGLIYLYVHQSRAVRTWPALLPFVPVMAWMAYHAPRLTDYARPDVAWYQPVSPQMLSDFLAYVTGVQTLQFGVFAALGIIVLWRLIRTGSQPVRDEEAQIDPAVRWTAIASVTGVAIAIGLAVLKPTLTDRYLTPAVPSILLGIVLCVRHIRGTHAAYAALATIFWLGSAAPFTLKDRLTDRAQYGYEDGSRYLAAAHPDHLVFAWDHPATKIMARASLDQIGGFFLRRAGQAVAVTPVTLSLAADPSPRLLAAATGPRPAILWLYDRSHGSVAARDGFAIQKQPGWQCRHSHRGRTGVVACAPSKLFAP